MKLVTLVLVVAALSGPAMGAETSHTYVGVITDTMCATDHKPMKVSPDARCVKECVRDGTAYKYALADGKGLYPLSDQETPAKFAGRRVRVTGVLFAKTNIIKVQALTAAN